MGVLGNPAKYSLVVGEYEEESPWESFAVEHGFSKEDNILTMFFPNTYIQTIPSDTDAQGILDILSRMGPSSMSCLMVIPSHAKILSSEGWTKKKVKEYIAKHAVPPFPPLDGSRPVVTREMDVENLMILVAGGPGAWTMAFVLIPRKIVFLGQQAK
jgi:hypothetical protein